MIPARAIADAIADRVIDEDAAIALAAAPPDLADSILDMLHDAAGRDGVSDDEALAVAQQAASLALRAWLDSEAGRRALLAAIRAVARDRGHRGISAAEARQVERITGAHVAARRDRATGRSASSRDETTAGSSGPAGNDTGPTGPSGAHARSAGGGA